MGVVIKQSAGNALSNYLGVIVGAINILILYPRAFADDPDYFGLVQLIISYSLVVGTIINIGAPGIILRYFPELENEERPPFLGFFMLFPIPFLAVFTGVVYFFRDEIIPFLNDQPLFQEYWFYILPLAFLSVYFEILASISYSHLKSTLPVFLKEVERRVAVSILLLLYWFDWINFDWFLFLYLASISIQFAILIIHLWKNNFLNLKLSFWNPKYKPMMIYGIFMLTTTGANFLVNKIDSLMVGKFVNLENVAYYSIAFFIGSILNVPGKSLYTITRPFISQAFASGDMKQIEKIYKDTALNLLLIGLLLFILLWLNIDDLFYLLPKNYREGKDVVMIIALAQLFNLASGQSGIIIATSKYYRFNVVALLFMLVVAISVNLWLIPKYGIIGAAIATVISLFFFNTMKAIFLKAKLNIIPYRPSMLLLLPLTAAVAGIGLLADFVTNPLVNIIIRSCVMILAFVAGAYFLKISPDINRLIKKALRYVA